MEERRNAIIDLLNEKSSLSFAQLKEAFPNVSEMTLRNDVKALDQEHRLIRVYGGIRSIQYVVGSDGLFEIRKRQNIEAKKVIASKAVKLIRPDTTIYLDSGTTTSVLASQIPDIRIILFTNGIYSLIELQQHSQINVIVPGGSLNRFSMALKGSRAIRELRDLKFDQLFLGLSGCSGDGTLSSGSDEEADVKRMCIERSEQRIALIDSSKLGRSTTFSFCTYSDIDIVVTDGKAPKEYVNAWKKAGIEVL